MVELRKRKMRKRVTDMGDGRYRIYYTFTDDQEDDRVSRPASFQREEERDHRAISE